MIEYLIFGKYILPYFLASIFAVVVASVTFLILLKTNLNNKMVFVLSILTYLVCDFFTILFVEKFFS